MTKIGAGTKVGEGTSQARRGVMDHAVPSRNTSERGPQAGRRAAQAASVSESGKTPPEAPPRSGHTKAGIVSAESMRQSEQAWFDQQITTSSCAFCDWRHEGPAAEGRAEARAHREKEHPEACAKKPRLRRRNLKKKSLRSADEEAQVAVDTQEARRLRSEREQAEMLAKIERGRLRRAALDEAVA